MNAYRDPALVAFAALVVVCVTIVISLGKAGPELAILSGLAGVAIGRVSGANTPAATPTRTPVEVSDDIWTSEPA